MDATKIESARIFSHLESSASDLYASANGWRHYSLQHDAGQIEYPWWMGFHRAFTIASVMAMTRVFDWGPSHRYVSASTRARFLATKRRFDDVGLMKIRSQVIAHAAPKGSRLPLSADEVAQLLKRLAPLGFDAYFAEMSGPTGSEHGTIARLFIDMATDTMDATSLTQDDIRMHG